MRFNGGIGYEIDQLKDLGVPELMRKQSIDPQLKYALALQEATKLVEAAVRERDMAQQMPVPADVIGQMETGLAQKLTPGVQQRGQRSMQGAPPQMAPPQMAQGISSMPAPNMGAIGSAQGGIIGYQQGGPIAPSVLAETTAYMKAKAVLADPQATPQAKAFAQNTLDTLRPINAGGSVDPQTYAQMLQQVDSLTAFSTQPQQNTGMKEGGFLYPSQLASEKILEFIRPAVKNNTDIDKILDSLKMAESSGNPLARGEAGELGAYQIMPSTAADPGFGVAPFTGDLFDPVASRKFAQEYLQAMLDRYNGNMEAALVAYNAGAGNADKFVAAGNDYTALPRPEQTKTYVQRVMDTPSEGRISPRYARALEASRRREAGETETGFSDDLRNALAPPPAESDRDPMAQRARAAGARLERRNEGQPNDTVGPVSPYTSEEKAAGGLGYLQYLARRQQEQQSNNANKMRTAFPDLEENIAETNRSRAYTPEETTAGGLGYLQYLARKKREQQKQQSNIAGYLAQSQRAANTIAENDPSANHGVDTKLPYRESPAQRLEDAFPGMGRKGGLNAILKHIPTNIETMRQPPAGNYGVGYAKRPEKATMVDFLRDILGFQEGGQIKSEEEITDEAFKARTGRERPTSIMDSVKDFFGKFANLEYVVDSSGNIVPNPSILRSSEDIAKTMEEYNKRIENIRAEIPGLTNAEVVELAGQESYPTTPEEEPPELSNADRMRAAFPGLEEHLANLKTQKASGISSVRPQQNNLFRALDVLSRGGGASKGYEFATINEETRRIKEAEQARQDNLYELEQRSDIAREQLGVTRAGQSVDIQTAIMQALEEYESSPAYTSELAARKDAGETEESARTFLLERKYQELAAMVNSGGNNSGIGGMPGLEQDGVAAAQYLQDNPY